MARVVQGQAIGGHKLKQGAQCTVLLLGVRILAVLNVSCIAQALRILVGSMVVESQPRSLAVLSTFDNGILKKGLNVQEQSTKIV